MKRLALALALLLAPSLAWGQCSGSFPANTVCGTLSAGVPHAVSSASFPVNVANPTGAVGLTAVNGTATTALRSDGAPPLSSSVQSALTQTNNQVLTGTGAFGFSSVTAVNNAILQTNGSGVPSWQTGLPSGVFANPTASVGLTAVNGSAVTAMRSDAAPALSQSISPTWTGNHTFAPTSGNAIAVNPAASSTAKGIVISQTGTTTTTGADFAYNSTTAAQDHLNTSGGANAATYGQYVELDTGGATAKGQKIALRALTNVGYASTVLAGDAIGLSGWSISAQNQGGGSGTEAGTLYGGEFIGHAFSGATFYSVVAGAEYDAIIDAGASAKNRWGASFTGNGSGTGSSTDAAVEIGSVTAAGEWKTAILLDSVHGFQPITNTGCVICTDASTFTIGNFVDMTNVTVSTNIFKFTNFQMTGAGVISLATWQGGVIAGLYGGTGLSTAAVGDIIYASATTPTWSRLADVATGSVLVSGGVNTAPAWSANPTLTTLALSSPGATTEVLTVNANSSGATALSDGVTVTGADTRVAGFNVVTYGNQSNSIYQRANGTKASPTKILSGNNIFRILVRGYDGSGVFSSNQATLSAQAGEDWNGTTNRGIGWAFNTTPNGSGTSVQSLTLQPSGGLSIGAVTDPGTGGLYVNGATITLNGLATDATHTDRTVCQDTTSKSLFFGSGAAGICLGTSSARFKRDIQPFHSSLDKLVQIEPKTFFYKKGHGDDGARRQFGVLAEDVAKVFPSFVGYDADHRPNTVDWPNFIWVSINAIKELKVANDNMRQEILDIKQRLKGRGR